MFGGFGSYFALLFGLVFTHNFVLSQFLGLCPFFGVSKNRSAALGMGGAVVLVMTLAAAVTMLLYKGVFLHPRWREYALAEYLDIVSFILVIAALVQFIETVMKKTSPALYRALGIFLPLITTNCAVLGATQLYLLEFSRDDYSLGAAVGLNALVGFGGGLGFSLALYLMASVRERFEHSAVPESLRGAPIAFLAGCCMALAFWGLA